MLLAYDIQELVPYINWVYFFYAWQVKNDDEKAHLRQEAEAFLTQWEGRYRAYGLFELFEAYADGDDIVVYKGVRSQEDTLFASATRRISFPLSLRFYQSSEHISYLSPLTSHL